VRDGPSINELLVSVVLVLVVILLGTMCFISWRAARTATRILDQVDRVVDRVESLERKLDSVVPFDEVESILDEVAVLRPGVAGDVPELEPEAEAEVKYLLRCIRKSGLQFEYSGKAHSATRFYLQLYSKFRAYKNTLSSGRDFIEKVATRTIAGNVYYVLTEDGNGKVELAEWLRGKLAAGRVDGK